MESKPEFRLPADGPDSASGAAERLDAVCGDGEQAEDFCDHSAGILAGLVGQKLSCLENFFCRLEKKPSRLGGFAGDFDGGGCAAGVGADGASPSSGLSDGAGETAAVFLEPAGGSLDQTDRCGKSRGYFARKNFRNALDSAAAIGRNPCGFMIDSDSVTDKKPRVGEKMEETVGGCRCSRLTV